MLKIIKKSLTINSWENRPNDLMIFSERLAFLQDKFKKNDSIVTISNIITFIIGQFLKNSLF